MPEQVDRTESELSDECVIMIPGVYLAIFVGLAAGHVIGGTIGAVMFGAFATGLAVYTLLIISLSLVYFGMVSIENYVGLEHQNYRQKERQLRKLANEFRTDHTTPTEREIKEDCADRLEEVLEEGV
jgi:hypothetical protein